MDQLPKLWEQYGAKPKQAQAADPGEESVWSYPRPPAVILLKKDFSISLGQEKILLAKQAIKMMETASPPTYYFDRESFNCTLVPSEKRSHCEWKGIASYLHFELSGQLLENVAWSYEKPYGEYDMLKGLISIYPSKFDIFIDQEKVRAQPGDFYGGWITSAIKGPFKGDPGTGSW